jgi:serine/threonine protein kinase
MGVVYEAVQESLGRPVALKVSTADRGQGLFLERFWGEARSAARLHHTNIVPVFGVGRAGNTHIYVLQHIDGRGLDCPLEDVHRRQLATQLPMPLRPGSFSTL